ncbi:MAG: type IV secretion system protein [Lactobacillaceae bacterium]|jgi:type IV secretory pathway component VirB8|nr:type IV secretion system protein [Lactobacillaceae bacterium]
MAEQDKKLLGTKILSLPGIGSDIDMSKFFLSDYKKVTSSKLIYYIWLSRFFILLAAISLLFFISASLVIFKLAPQVSVEPFLIIRQDNSAGIVRNEPISYDMASKQMLMETFVKQYIILRNTIIDDEKEMQTRWYPGGMVDFLSSPEIFGSFDQYREKVWHLIFEAKLSREVEIISINKVGGEKSAVWKIDFKTYDISEGQRDLQTRAIILNTRYWTSSVTAYFIPERSFLGLRLLNPLGFTVTRYSQTEVEV